MINIYNYSITLFSILSMLITYLYIRQFYIRQENIKTHRIDDLVIYIFFTYVILGLSTKLLGDNSLFALSLILPIMYKDIRLAMIGIGLHPLLVLSYVFREYTFNFNILLIIMLSEYIIGMIMWAITNYWRTSIMSATLVTLLLSSLHTFINLVVSGMMLTLGKFLILVIMNFIFILILDKINTNFEHRRAEIILKLKDYEMDGLTGLYNFRQLRTDFLQYSHDKRKLTLILLDIDYFKGINDKYGHEMGNKALHLIAENLTSTMLDYFTQKAFKIYRYGGEELAIVIFQDDIRVKGILSELKASLVQASQTEFPFTLTFSAGVSFNVNFAGDNQQTFNRADQLLYRIKNNSRDSYLIDNVVDIERIE